MKEGNHSVGGPFPLSSLSVVKGGNHSVGAPFPPSTELHGCFRDLVDWLKTMIREELHDAYEGPQVS